MKNCKINHKNMIYSQYKLPTTLFHQKIMKLKKKKFLDFFTLAEVVIWGSKKGNFGGSW